MFDSVVNDPEYLKELLKIVVDKGLIGVLLLLAGYCVSKSIERYKSAQAIVQEQQKILYPQALKILDAADDFEALVNKKLAEIDGDISRIADLLRQVVAQRGPEIELDERTAKDALAQTDAWSRLQIIDLPICNRKTLRNLLLEAVSDQDLKSCIARMVERKPLSDRVLPHNPYVLPRNPYVLDVDNARERLITALRDLKRSLPGGPLFTQYRSPVNDVMAGLVFLYLHELTQPHKWQVLAAYQRLLGKVAEIPLIHCASVNPDVDGFLLKDSEYTLLSNARTALARYLDAYVPYEYLAPSSRATLSPFDLLHTRIRLTIRRMLLPGRRYQQPRLTVVAAKAEKRMPSQPVQSALPKGAELDRAGSKQI